MIRTVSTLLLGAFLTFTAAAAGNPHSEKEALFLRFNAGSCTGTAIAPRTILTATHCFEGGDTRVKVNGRLADIWKRIDDGHDHTIVEVSVVLPEYAKIGPAPQRGDDVYIYGNPGRLNDIFRHGYMSGYGVVDGERAQLFELPTWFGDSGSGIFNAKGEVVAVLTGGDKLEDQGYSIEFAYTYPLAFTAKQLREAGVE